MKTSLKKIRETIEHRVNRIIGMLVINGVLLLILAFLVVWSPLVLQLLIGLIVIIVAVLFFYLAYRIWDIKKHLEKFLK